jgi:hypothetical protein
MESESRIINTVFIQLMTAHFIVSPMPPSARALPNITRWNINAAPKVKMIGPRLENDRAAPQAIDRASVATIAIHVQAVVFVDGPDLRPDWQYGV